MKRWTVIAALIAGAVGASSHAIAQPDATEIERGAYLVHASDCEVCHTKPGGVPFAGGRAFRLPGIGTIYSTNLTPDAKTGIGAFSEAEFSAAVRKGVSRGWKHLYPVMPYTSYAYLSEKDSNDILAWLKTLKPQVATIPANSVNFPFNIRLAMIGWNLLYRPSPGPLNDTSRSADWNRGRWLVEGPGHCAECHSPRNKLFAKSASQSYAGANANGWMAYNISSDPDSGIGAWSDDDLAAYFKTGHADGHGTAAGPMAEVVSYGLRHLTDSDRKAMVVYLRSLSQRKTSSIMQRMNPDALREASVPQNNGTRIFNSACVGCHLQDGTGRQVDFAALWGARTVAQPDGHNLVRVILHGSKLDTPVGRVVMPQVGDEYTDRDIADVANYVIAHFGNRAGHVTSSDVQTAISEPE